MRLLKRISDALRSDSMKSAEKITSKASDGAFEFLERVVLLGTVLVAARLTGHPILWLFALGSIFFWALSLLIGFLIESVPTANVQRKDIPIHFYSRLIELVALVIVVWAAADAAEAISRVISSS